MKLNKKGFTLVELLAVIVILAVVMLVAITAIGPVMERANKGAVSSSAQIILAGAENAYTADQMSASAARKFKAGTDTCVSIKALSDAQYFDGKGKEYVGSVLVSVSSSNVVTYKIWLMEHGTTYVIEGKESKELGVDVVTNATGNFNDVVSPALQTATGKTHLLVNTLAKAGNYCGNASTYKNATIGKLNA